MYLDIYKEYKIKNDEIYNLVQDCHEELTDNKGDLYINICKFYELRNIKRKSKIKKLEFIKQKDQEYLNIFDIKTSKNVSNYEIDKHLIIDLLNNCSNLKNKITKIQYSQNYREKQIQFCYSLLNINLRENYFILKHIMKTLLEYNELQTFEIEFLMYIWNFGGKVSIT